MSFSYYGELCTEVYDLTKKVGQSFSGDIEYYRYEAIIIPGGSFLLIEQREESIQVLNRLYEHLEPGGRLILDLFLPDNNYNSSELGRWDGMATYHLPNGDLITMEGKNAEVDLFFNQYRVSYLKYEKW